MHVLELEVTDQAQQRALGATLADETIDVLIHNAGVHGTRLRDRLPDALYPDLLDPALVVFS